MEVNENGQIIYNEIETAFNLFFEANGIELSDKTPQSQIEAGFLFVYNRLYKPKKGQKLLYNCKTIIDLDNIDQLEYIYNTYENICKLYNVIPFINYFYSLTGISHNTIYSWYNKQYDKKGLSDKYYELAKKIRNLPKIQTQSKLADKDLGVTVLANNDLEVGLEYNGKRQLEIESAKQLSSVADLRNLLTSNNNDNK